MPLGTTADIDTWLPKFMKALSVKTQIPLAEAPSDNGLDSNQWRRNLDSERAWTQKVTVQFASEKDLRKVHETIQGTGISIAGREAGISIEAPAINLDKGGRVGC